MDIIVELLNHADSACARYEQDGRHEDFAEAVGSLEEVIIVTRELPDQERLSYALALTARAQRARFARSSDREALAAAYVSALEAVHQATEGNCLRYAREVAAAVFGVLDTVLDRGGLADIDWDLALARGLAERLDDERYFLLARIAAVLNRRAAITRARDDILAMVETAARAVDLCPAGFRSIGEMRVAAQGWSFLGRTERAPDLARQGADMWRRAVAVAEYDDSNVTWLINGLLVVDSLEDSDDDSAFQEALRHMRELAERPDDFEWLGDIRGMNALDSVSLVVFKYVNCGDDAHLDAAMAFGTWCLRNLLRYGDPAEALELMAHLWILHDERYAMKRRSEDFDRRAEYADRIRRSAQAGSELRQLVGEVEEREAFTRELWRTTGRVSSAVADGRVYVQTELISIPIGRWPPSAASPLGCSMTARCTRALHYPAGTDGGPVPVLVPSRLLNVEITATAPAGQDAVIRAIRVTIDARDPLTLADVFISGQEGVGDFDHHVDLDAQYLGISSPAGPPASLVRTVRRGATETISVAASARKWDTRWHLEIDWTCGTRSGTFSAPLRTTGESGFRQYGPPACLAGDL